MQGSLSWAVYSIDWTFALEIKQEYIYFSVQTSEYKSTSTTLLYSMSWRNHNVKAYWFILGVGNVLECWKECMSRQIRAENSVCRAVPSADLSGRRVSRLKQWSRETFCFQTFDHNTETFQISFTHSLFVTPTGRWHQPLNSYNFHMPFRNPDTFQD